MNEKIKEISSLETIKRIWKNYALGLSNYLIMIFNALSDGSAIRALFPIIKSSLLLIGIEPGELFKMIPLILGF